MVDAARQRWRLKMAAMFGVFIVGVLASGVPAVDDLFPRVCLVKAIAGVECPACGITRSASLVLSGDWAESLRIHPAGAVVMLAVLASAAYFGFTYLFKVSVPREWRMEVKMFAAADLAVVLLLVAGWVKRTLSGWNGV